MTEYIRISPFLATVISMSFIFSTLFTLAYFYYQGAGVGYNGGEMGHDATTPVQGLIAVLSVVLDLISWASPVALLKAFFGYNMASTPILYTLLDMLLLRPLGWVMAVVEINFIISKIPTISGE